MPISIGQNTSAEYAAEVAKYADKAGIGNVKIDKTVFDDKIGAAAFEKLKPGAWSTSTNSPDFSGDILANPASSSGAEAWVFITAPGTVSYTQQSEVSRLNIFGTNSPPVVVGAKGMRDLTLSEALMEGFTLGRSVQPHIDRLESLMNVAVNTKDGFVNVPVYKVYAGPEGGGKDYGYYVIEQIEIEEQLRDLKGNATRAMVGVSLKQVPQYQVGTGVDQAGAATRGDVLDSTRFATNQSRSQDARVASNSRTTPSAQAQTVSGVEVPAGATNISSSVRNGTTTVTYYVNGIQYKKTV